MTQSTSQQQPIGVCIILLNSKDEVLLGKRKNAYKAGWFGMPGGRVELNEPLQSAVNRELDEETGLTNITSTYVGVVRENQGSYDFIHFVFSAEIGDAQPKLGEPDKCEGWQWFDLSANFDTVLPGHQAALSLFKSKKSLKDMTNLN